MFPFYTIIVFGGSVFQIFAGAFPNGNYEPPTGFHFEVDDDSPIVQVYALISC